MKKILQSRPPELNVQMWLNTNQVLSLTSLHGKVIAIYAFQMLCPGCVEYSIPQARRVHTIFASQGVTVIGLHTVFEHHAAMAEVSLRAFLQEYQIEFPVAIDTPSDQPGNPIPETMQAYNLRGTPSLLLIDKKGQLRKHKMGHEHDLIVGAELSTLMNEV